MFGLFEALNKWGIPVEAPADEPPRAHDTLTPDEAGKINAYRRGNLDEIAYFMVKQFIEQGKTVAEILQPALDNGDADVINAYIKALYRVLKLAPAYAYKPDPTMIPYEQAIAVYIVGRLALGQWLTAELMNSTCDLADDIADWFAEGLRRYDWRGSLQEAIYYAHHGKPRGWKSVDLASDEDGAE